LIQTVADAVLQTQQGLAGWSGEDKIVRCLGRTLMWSAVLAVQAGCAEHWRPTPRVELEVEGRVHDGPRPISGGWIEFIPVDGAVGHLRSAPIQPDGTFRATRVGAGPHVVRLVQPSSPGVDPAFQQFTSPIRVVIEPGESVEIDLARERLRLRSGGGT
jgi:hypothetical protein